VTAVLALARHEVRAEVRGRTVPIFAALFALAAMAIALTGMSAGGSVVVQGFGRTAISLLQLTLWVVPLVALTLSALAASEAYDLEAIAAQPVSRAALVLGGALGRWVAVSGSLLLGYGAAGLLIAGLAGSGDAWRFAALLATGLGLSAACVAVGTLAGVLARTRTRSLAFAALIWLVFSFGFDLLAIGALSILPRAELVWSLSGLLVLNPVAAARSLGLGLFGAEATAGPMGAALRMVLGPAGLAVLGAGLVAWAAVPLAVATRVFSGRDLS
jgi:Cu-processing system permease protein